jgi:hypothetical protein
MLGTWVDDHRRGIRFFFLLLASLNAWSAYKTFSQSPLLALANLLGAMTLLLGARITWPERISDASKGLNQIVDSGPGCSRDALANKDEAPKEPKPRPGTSLGELGDKVRSPAERRMPSKGNRPIHQTVGRRVYDRQVQRRAYLETVAQRQKAVMLNVRSSLAHYHLAENFLYLNNYGAAADEIRKALNGDLDPKWVEVWARLMLGRIYDATGQRDHAIVQYQLALETHDNTRGALDEAAHYILSASPPSQEKEALAQAS